MQVNCTTRTWNVSTGTTGQGTIDPPTAQVNDAANQAFTLTPATGYHIDSVSGCSGTLNASTYTTGPVTADCAISATFAIDTFTLSYSSDSTGTIGGTPVQSVNYGDSGTAVTALPNAHYHFVQWSDGVQTAVRTDSNIRANLSVAATFAIDAYTLTYAAGANGFDQRYRVADGRLRRERFAGGGGRQQRIPLHAVERWFEREPAHRLPTRVAISV